MQENASLSVELQNFLAIGKDGLGSPSLGPGSAAKNRLKQPKKISKWSGPHIELGRGKGRRGLETCLWCCHHSMTPGSDIMLWLVKMSQCWQIRGAVDRWNTMLFQYRNASMCFQTRISSKQYKFLCKTFQISLGSKKSKKYVYGLLQKEKEAFKISSFLHSPVINYGRIYKTIEP